MNLAICPRCFSDEIVHYVSEDESSFWCECDKCGYRLSARKHPGESRRAWNRNSWVQTFGGLVIVILLSLLDLAAIVFVLSRLLGS